MKITIQGELPTTNDIIAAQNTQNRYVYANMKKDYTALAMMSALNKSKITNKVDLHFTWICKNKRKDPDNISGGAKFILDGLVKAKVLENDGWKQINSIRHDFEIDKDNPRVEITIKEQG